MSDSYCGILWYWVSDDREESLISKTRCQWYEFNSCMAQLHGKGFHPWHIRTLVFCLCKLVSKAVFFVDHLQNVVVVEWATSGATPWLWCYRNHLFDLYFYFILYQTPSLKFCNWHISYHPPPPTPVNTMVHPTLILLGKKVQKQRPRRGQWEKQLESSCAPEEIGAYPLKIFLFWVLFAKPPHRERAGWATVAFQMLSTTIQVSPSQHSQSWELGLTG